MKRKTTQDRALMFLFIFSVVFATLAPTVCRATDKPNILIIFPDDVGWENISAYLLASAAVSIPYVLWMKERP